MKYYYCIVNKISVWLEQEEDNNPAHRQVPAVKSDFGIIGLKPPAYGARTSNFNSVDLFKNACKWFDQLQHFATSCVK